MNFLKSLGGLVGSNAATGGLPYIIDGAPAAASSPDAGPPPPHDAAGYSLPDFQLFAGHSKTDASLAVSIFKSKQGATQPTLNALKRIKTLRHPNILSYLDGVEMPNAGPVVIVTEAVVPLAQYLDELRRQYGSQSDEFQMSVAWGLRSILLALQFLTVDCKLLHGRVNPHSVFATKGGDWKLGGLELTGELTSDGPSYVYTAFEQFSDASYKPPECQRRDWKAVGQAPPFAVDIYAFAALLYYVANDSQVRANDLQSATNIPQPLRLQYRKAVEADPRRRPSPDKLLATAYFDTPFIKRMDFLENLAVKTPEEKVEFYKDLCNNLATLPQIFGVHKVLPALKAVVEFSAASAGKNAPMKLDPSASHMLPAMVQIGSSMPVEEFKEQVMPVIVKLFSCNDRAVRVQLLQMMEKFAVHFDAKLVNSPVIFDNLCSGFTDAAPILRELTVKSMLHIADKLSDANLNTRVMKHFAKLQVDPEPAIRTNTTICLGRIAPKLNEATRPKVLFPAFSRALRDPFPHARLAGLRSLTACDEFFSPQGVAASVVPAISPLLVDVSISVRDQAKQSMDLFMKKVMDEAAQMKVREEQQAHEQKLKQEAGGGVAAPVPEAAPTSSSGHGVAYAASLTSWAASAVGTAVVSKIAGSVGSSNSSSRATSAASTRHTSAPAVASTASASSSSASTAFAVADDDCGEDDDAWGQDDDLDGGFGNASSTTTAFASTASRAPTAPSSSSGMKLSVAHRTPPKPTPSPFAMPSATSAAVGGGSGWGDDNWGDDDALGFDDPKPPARTTSFGTTSTLGGVTTTSSSNSSASRTASFGSTTPALASASSFASAASASSLSSATTASRKSVSERLAEAKAKREAGGAMKLDGAKKKGDEWDNWDF